MTKDLPEAIGADVSPSDVLVPINPRPDWGFRIVGVHQPDVFESDRGVEPSQRLVQPVSGVDRVAGGKQVRGVNAEPRLNRALEAPKNRRQFLEARAQDVSLTRSVLHQDHQRADLEPASRLDQRLHESLSRDRAITVLGAPRMNHYKIRSQCHRTLELAAEGGDGESVDQRIAGSEIDQIIGVYRERPEIVADLRCAESLALLR